jgi:hypothetical protein
VAADLEQLPDDPAVFDLWTKVMTRIARTEMDLGHLDAARASIERVLRVAPDLAMDRSLHPARFVGEVESVRAAVKALPSGTLVVESSAAGARVLVNGRDVGTAPARLTLPRGSYRITGTKGRARVRSIAEVGEQEHEVRLDFSIDETLRPELGPGVALRPEHRQGDLVAIGRYLGLDQIVAVGTTGDGDASYVVAELHVVRGDAPERRARVRLANGALPEGAAAALAEFLVTGRVTSPLVEVPGEPRVPPSPPPDAPRLRPFVGGGLLVPAAPEKFTRAWRPGMALGVGGEYALANVAALWGMVEYARILVREDGAKETVTVYGPITSVRGGDFTMLSLRLGVRLRRPSGRLRPYADLGLGIDRISTDTIELEYEDPTTHQTVMLTPFRIDDTKARALTAGLGVQYAPRPSLTMFADVHATFLDAPDQCYPRFDLCFLTGGETRYGSIRLGVLFR